MVLALRFNPWAPVEINEAAAFGTPRSSIALSPPVGYWPGLGGGGAFGTFGFKNPSRFS